MDKYTEKFFFKEIQSILNERPIEEIRPFFIYRDSSGSTLALHSSGNKIITEDMSEVHYLIKKWMRT